MRTHVRGPVVRLLTAVLTTALALVGLVALTTATAPVAHAAAGSISGTVTAAGTGTPLAGMTVVAFCNKNGDWRSCEETTSGAGGTYTFDLPDGTYHVGAYSDDSHYAAAFFGGTDRVNAADIVPPASDVDLVMAPNATVKGRVGQGLLNSPVADVDVCLYEQVTYDGQTAWECVSSAITAANGTYTLWAEPGTYRVGFSVADNHLREVFYPNAATVEAATNLVVGAAGRTGINVKVVPNAQVTGKVTVQGTATAIAGAQVRAYELVEDGADSSWDWNHATTADASGNYQLYLAPGDYRIEFDNACPGDGLCSAIYRSEFWNDKATVETANDVTVGNSGTVANVNGALARNAKITGTVTAADGGAPIAGAGVTALQEVTGEYEGETFTYWEPVSWASAGATGGYELYVAPGTYRVSFDDGFDGCEATCPDVYQTEYWQESADLETADDVTIAGSATLSGRNGTLARNGHITGTVTAEAGGAGLPNVDVVAFDEETYEAGGETYTDWVPVGSTTTDAEGDYALPAPPGSHRVGFFESCWGADCRYLSEFYDDVATPEAGTDVTITGPATTTPGIDAELAEGSLISGTLTDDADAPVSDAFVTVYAEDAGEWTPQAYSWSDDDGSYAVLVPDGSFRVGFSSFDDAFTEEFYDDSLTLAGADTLVVAGANKPNVDATLGLEVVNLAAPTVPDADPTVGETISAGTGTWSVTPDAFTYRWFQAGTSAPIGTEKDLVVPAGALGKQLTVEVTAKKAGYADGVATSAPSVAVAQGVLTSSAKPSVSGAVSVGSTVQALEGTWSATPDAYTYRWFQAGSTDPIGTSKELVVPAGAVGKTLTVEVTATKAGHATGVATSDPSAAVVEGQLLNDVEPTVSGTLKVGETVTAIEGEWSHDPESYTYRWFQAGKADPIGTGKQLVIPGAAVGKALTVEVTATADGFGTSTAVSEPTAGVAPGTFANTAEPTITGDVKVGATVQAVEGTWSPTPGSYGYQWFQSGTPDPIGTGKNLVVPAGAAGKTLTVKVFALKVGYTPASVTSDPTAEVEVGDLANTAVPTVAGTVQVGRTVTAGNGAWSATTTGHTYRWFESGTTDPIGTGKDLVVPPSAGGRTLTVEVTATADGYADGVASSEPIEVALGDLANTAVPTVTGTVQVGKTVTATPGTWSPVPAANAFGYTWFRSGSDDPIGTGKDLVVPAGAAGETLTVEVTATVPGYAPSSVSSAATPAVATGDAVANTAKPTITGSVQVGQTVTAQAGTWALAPDSYTYRWFLTGTTDPIGTQQDLVVPDGAAGKSLSVKVTAKKAGYADGTASSDPVAVPIPSAKAPVNTVKPTITGKAQVGETLTADAGTWSPVPTAVAYAWYANGLQLKNVTGNRLTLTPELANKVIRVLVVVASVPGLNGAEWTNATAPVALGTLEVTGKPTLTGKAKVGKKLKVVLPAAVPAGATVKVQWLLGKQAIPGATKKSLKLNNALYHGTKVRAVVVWTLPGYAPVTLKTAKVRIK